MKTLRIINLWQYNAPFDLYLEGEFLKICGL